MVNVMKMENNYILDWTTILSELEELFPIPVLHVVINQNVDVLNNAVPWMFLKILNLDNVK